MRIDTLLTIQSLRVNILIHIRKSYPYGSMNSLKLNVKIWDIIHSLYIFVCFQYLEQIDTRRVTPGKQFI